MAKNGPLSELFTKYWLVKNNEMVVTFTIINQGLFFIICQTSIHLPTYDFAVISISFSQVMLLNFLIIHLIVINPIINIFETSNIIIILKYFSPKF